jgi:hypothetical protein
MKYLRYAALLALLAYAAGVLAGSKSVVGVGRRGRTGRSWNRRWSGWSAGLRLRILPGLSLRLRALRILWAELVLWRSVHRRRAVVSRRLGTSLLRRRLRSRLCGTRRCGSRLCRSWSSRARYRAWFGGWTRLRGTRRLPWVQRWGPWRLRRPTLTDCCGN